MRKVAVYCPKCHHKTLIRKYDNLTGYYFWWCGHGQPKKETSRTRLARRRRMIMGQPEPPPAVPCGCEIKVEDRDAEVSDYGTVLDGILRAQEPAIKLWLLENPFSKVHRRGLEVLYEGELVDVVRLSDADDGVAVWVYFRDAWNSPSARQRHPNDAALSSPAARHIKFEGVDLFSLFRSYRFCVWRKDNEDCLFSGNLGKRRRAEIVKWAKRLELEMPDLISLAEKEARRWRDERIALASSVKSVAVENYDGNRRLARISIRAWLTPEQIEVINGIVSPCEEQ